MPAPKVWKPALAMIALLGVAGIAVWTLGESDPGPIYEGPMVQLPGPREFTLTWRMPASADDQAVEVVVRDGAGNESVFAATPGERFVARATGLEPGTFYNYEVRRRSSAGGGGAITLAEGRTRTAPLPGGSFRFVVTGDTGSGSKEQYELGRLMYEQDPDLIIHVGDIVHPDGTLRYYPSQFFAPYADLLKRSAVYPCLGNHDWDTNQGEAVFQVFELPDTGIAGRADLGCYWFDFADVRFAALNSNVAFSQVKEYQVPWLESVLDSAADRFKVVFFHHPIQTSRMHASRGAFRTLIEPVMDRYGVDLVLVGHNHTYERSHPLRNDQIVEAGQGTVHITAGAGGSSLRQFGSPQPGFMAARDDSQYSITVVDVEPTRMKFQQVGLARTVLDRFEIPRHSPATQPLAQVTDATP